MNTGLPYVAAASLLWGSIPGEEYHELFNGLGACALLGSVLLQGIDSLANYLDRRSARKDNLNTSDQPRQAVQKLEKAASEHKL